MSLIIGTTKARVFTTTPRAADLGTYWNDFRNTITWSEKYNYTGTLIFTGNDIFVEPWLLANYILGHAKSLCPLVAINPVYMHPFTAAKMVSSLTFLYGRTIFLNMVTGTALSYQEALGDKASHDERYVRLSEYMAIMSALLSSAKPVSIAGNYYQVSNLQLYPVDPRNAKCEFFLAGQSEAAQTLLRKYRGVGVQMLSSELEQGVKSRGIHCGIVTRPSQSEACTAARALFPSDKEAQDMLDYSMSNTDSVWKQVLRRKAANPEIEETGYWLGPFRNFKADCPYFVGSYDRVATLLMGLIGAGADTLILDIIASEEEYAHIDATFSIARTRLD